MSTDKFETGDIMYATKNIQEDLVISEKTSKNVSLLSTDSNNVKNPNDEFGLNASIKLS